MAKVVEYILSETVRGTGTDEDPVRTVLQLWTLDGELLAEYDSYEQKGWWKP